MLQKIIKISVTIIGIGNLGNTFLKIVLWMFQIYGYTLEINVIDSEKVNSLQKKLKKEMPDIFQEKRLIASDSFPCYQLNHDGESNYLIRIIGGIQYQSSDLVDLLSGETQDFYINSQLFLIVNDDEKLNSELAISVRLTVEQLIIYTQRSRGDIKNSFVPKICAYIHDDVMVDFFVHEENLYPIHQNHSRKKQIPIKVIGRESEVYHYSSLPNWKRIEGEAMNYYFEWIATSARLREIYEESLQNYTYSPFLKKYMQEIRTCKDNNEGFIFSCDYLYENGRLSSDQIQHMLTDYYQNEFYRDSAVSSFLYNQKILPYFKEYFQSFLIDETMYEGDLPEICMCERCLNLRKSEHMRWMAFMETCGYIYSPIQSHAVKLNSFLLPWNKLPAFITYFTTCDLIRQ